MNRIVIVGTTGVGKTTLAEKLGHRLDIPCLDLDTLFWGPNWTSPPDDVFRQRVSEAIRGEHWVVGGNYRRARDLIWTKADTLIWLDYPLWLSMSRLFRRTIRRIITQEELFNSGNRETWLKQFFSRDSLFLWAVQSNRETHRDRERAFQQPEYRHLEVIRMRWPHETERWLEKITKKT
jgi:adenylate kinase family enzyme